MKRGHPCTFKSNGKLSCRNCSVNGEVKQKRTTMVSDNGFFFCLRCYHALERLSH